MRIAIAGAGAVGRSIAQVLLLAEHQVLLIERHRTDFRPELVPDADWMLADACELDALESAGIARCDVVIAATGDDRANLVFALLCKTQFAVPRVVARVNDPANQWLFTEPWGVDVAVSTPSAVVTAVEEAVSAGELVRLMTLHHGQSSIVEITLSEGMGLTGHVISDLALPVGAALLTILRGGKTIKAGPDARLQPGDEIVLVAAPGTEDGIRSAFGIRR